MLVSLLSPLHLDDTRELETTLPHSHRIKTLATQKSGLMLQSRLIPSNSSLFLCFSAHTHICTAYTVAYGPSSPRPTASTLARVQWLLPEKSKCGDSKNVHMEQLVGKVLNAVESWPGAIQTCL